MAGNSGPNIVNDGLLLQLDAGNLKSFRGDSTTNLISNADTMSGWFNYYRTITSSTFVTEFGTTGYRFDIQPSWNGIYRNFNLVNSGTYTFSAWFRYKGGSTNNNGATVYITNYGSGDTAVGLDKNLLNVWQRVTHTVSVSSPSNVYFYLISYGGTDNGTINPDFSSWEVTMPQIELKSYATPFVNGTRGTTVATGGGWADRTSNQNHGELINGPIYSSANGGSLVFDGTNDYINSTSFSSQLTTNITAESWIYVTSNSSDWVRIVGTGGNGGNRTFGLWYDADRKLLWQRYGAGDPSIYPSTPTIELNKWQHVCATTSGNSHALYLNGVSIGTATATGPWAASNENITIGFAGFHTYINGRISMVKIYNKGLSSQEVLQNYNSNKSRFGLP